MGKPAKTKPKKPHPSFPLTAHPNGQWCKKIRGTVHFFGVWAEPDAALSRYRELAPDLHAGRAPQPCRLSAGGLTVKDLCNAFLNGQKGKMEAREIGLRWYEDCRTAVRHTFRIWADEARDQHAVHRIMGHALPEMSGVYVEEISLARLRAVTELVRSKLPDRI